MVQIAPTMRKHSSRAGATRIAPAIPLALSSKRSKPSSGTILPCTISEPQLLPPPEPVQAANESLRSLSPATVAAAQEIDILEEHRVAHQYERGSVNVVTEDGGASENPAETVGNEGVALILSKPADDLATHGSPSLEPLQPEALETVPSELAPAATSSLPIPPLTLVSEGLSRPLSLQKLPPPFYPSQRPSSTEFLGAGTGNTQTSKHQEGTNSKNRNFGDYRDGDHTEFDISSSAPPPSAHNPCVELPPTNTLDSTFTPPSPFWTNGHVYTQPEMASTYEDLSLTFVPRPSGFVATAENHGHDTRQSQGIRPDHHYGFESHGHPLHYRPSLPLPNVLPPLVAPMNRASVEMDPKNHDFLSSNPIMNSLTNGFAPHSPAEQRIRMESPPIIQYYQHNNIEAPVFVRLKQGRFSRPDANESTTVYVLGQLGNRDFADVILQLSHAFYLFPFTCLPAHGLFLARSPRLRSLMVMEHYHSHPRVLNVHVSDRFLGSCTAFLEAVAYIYGGPLLDRVSLERLVAAESENSILPPSTARMSTVLSYAATGHFLQLHEVISRATALAADTMEWSNLSNALAFGVEGGLGTMWTYVSGTSSEDASNFSPQDDTARRAESFSAMPAYGMYSDRLLTAIIEFVVTNLPVSFKVHAYAPQYAEIPRLPASAEPKPSLSDTRLSHIRFGAMTLEEESQPAQEVIAASSVLLSLPFHLLRHVFQSPMLGERLGWPLVSDIARSVIDEREARRRRAALVAGSSQLVNEERSWTNLRWAESIEQSAGHPSGFRIIRHYLDAETPTSSRSRNS